MSDNLGYEKGEQCNRNECKGIIDEHASESCCSCHINPPCSYCTTCRAYCPVCEWDGYEEQQQEESKITERYYATEFAGLSVHQSKEAETYQSRVVKMMHGQLPRPNTLMYINEGHTHFSMIKKGVFPESMNREDLIKEVNGSFGGRFEFCDPVTGRFKFIAYTD